MKEAYVLVIEGDPINRRQMGELLANVDEDYDVQPVCVDYLSWHQIKILMSPRFKPSVVLLDVRSIGDPDLQTPFPHNTWLDKHMTDACRAARVIAYSYPQAAIGIFSTLYNRAEEVAASITEPRTGAVAVVDPIKWADIEKFVKQYLPH